jgi:hypothetical protein
VDDTTLSAVDISEDVSMVDVLFPSEGTVVISSTVSELFLLSISVVLSHRSKLIVVTVSKMQQNCHPEFLSSQSCFVVT